MQNAYFAMVQFLSLKWRIKLLFLISNGGDILTGEIAFKQNIKGNSLFHLIKADNSVFEGGNLAKLGLKYSTILRECRS